METTSKPAGSRKKAVSKSAKAGLRFPVGRIARYLKKGRYTRRCGAGAPVYLAAVLEYIAAEVLELAGNVARDSMKKRINPRHVYIALRNDKELGKVLKGTIPSSGFLPTIYALVSSKKSSSFLFLFLIFPCSYISGCLKFTAISLSSKTHQGIHSKWRLFQKGKLRIFSFIQITPLKKMKTKPRSSENQNKEHNTSSSLLDLLDLTLECILDRLSPVGLCAMAGNLQFHPNHPVEEDEDEAQVVGESKRRTQYVVFVVFVDGLAEVDPRMHSGPPFVRRSVRHGWRLLVFKGSMYWRPFMRSGGESSRGEHFEMLLG
ncbi:uncharacterized protein LOC120163305 [Hibiscus syriacus]|uniref:uncharacterized protein LOC120163305 n=1 Tax=Hibiscus syriacus TaxID=106335 RepID=UPI001921614A|nr:uncharacterized protein LOC120163305 [Hibiscus syriacus]